MERVLFRDILFCAELKTVQLAFLFILKNLIL